MISILEPELATRGTPRAVVLLGPDTTSEAVIPLAVGAGVLPVAIEREPDATLRLASERGARIVLADLRAGADAVARLVVEERRAVIALWSGQDAQLLSDVLAAGVTCFAALDGAFSDLRRVIERAIAGEPAIAEPLAPVLVALLSARLRETASANPVFARRRIQERFTPPGALRPVFQPIANLDSGRRFGYLALTRFADLAEEHTAARFAEAREHGLGRQLELAAARAALDQADRLPEDDLLFIKLSSATVACEQLGALLRDRHVSQIVLELTGHAEVREADSFYPSVARLRERGVRFAVDETGAGFGALDHVLDLAPSFVRLAGGLTRDIHSDRTRRALALAVTSFATHLGARVIADRIESEDELAALRRLGVSYGLGYHIGRPAELPPRPLRASGEPVQPLPGDGRAAEVPGLLWARGGAGTLPIAARARRDFADATHAVLRVVSDRLSPCLAYVGHVDRHADVLRLVDVTAAELPRIEPGQSFRLDTAIDPAVLDGLIPQLVADGRAVSDDDPRTMPAILGAEGWACVPFAGPPAAPFATLTVLVPDAGRLGEDELELLRDGAAILRDALRAEHDEPERLLRELAWRDRVTGVLNAARFHELLAAANSRNDGGGYLAHVSLSNFGTLGDRMGQAVADLVRNDLARALALQAESTDVIARVAATTFGCILPSRRAGEVDYFMRAVADQVAAAARRRGATAELRLGTERIGLGATSADAWQAATDGAQILH